MSSILATQLRGGGESLRIIYKVNNERRQIFLGSKYSRSWADEIATNVAKIAQSIDTGEPLRASVQAWLEECGDDLRERLIRSGLITIDKRYTVAEILTKFFAATAPTSAATTLSNRRSIAKRLIARFGDTLVNDISAADAAEYKIAELSQRSVATVAGVVAFCKTLFSWSVDNGFAESNPFAKLPRGSFTNAERQRYVSLECYSRLLDACPNQDWRTLLALCRVGGLRSPSESLSLRWCDINWEYGTILVHSRKTARHAGHETRVIPMFPGLREELEKQFDAAEPGGSPYVIMLARGTSANLRTQLSRIAFLAGLEPWPKLYQNLRVSRSNEVLREFGAVCESRWIGHSQRVANDHYSVVLESEMRRATGLNGVAIQQSPAAESIPAPSREPDRSTGHDLSPARD